MLGDIPTQTKTFRRRSLGRPPPFQFCVNPYPDFEGRALGPAVERGGHAARGGAGATPARRSPTRVPIRLRTAQKKMGEARKLSPIK